MYSTRNLVAGAHLLHGDRVIRVQRAAVAVAVMLSSSNVSPMTTILASLLFAALAGSARAQVWSARKTFSWPGSRTLVLVPAPSAQIGRPGPVVGGAQRTMPLSNESMTAGMQRLGAKLPARPVCSAITLLRAPMRQAA